MTSPHYEEIQTMVAFLRLGAVACWRPWSAMRSPFEPPEDVPIIVQSQIDHYVGSSVHLGA